MSSVVASFNSHLRKAKFSDFFSCSWLPCRFTRILWKPSIGDKLACERELDNCFDKFAIKVVNNGETVGHLPRKFSKTAWYPFWLYFGVLGMIHGKLQIFFQMFSQISRTPDFERSFRVKRCGLYAGVLVCGFLYNGMCHTQPSFE